MLPIYHVFNTHRKDKQRFTAKFPSLSDCSLIQEDTLDLELSKSVKLTIMIMCSGYTPAAVAYM